MLLFPDGDAGLEFVDDGAAGVEGGAAMGGGDANPDGEIPDLEMTDTVNGLHGQQIEALPRLGQDAIALLFGEVDVRFVLERAHRLPVIMVPNPALERDAGSGRGVREACLQLGGF